jgi:hypothetical protein
MMMSELAVRGLREELIAKEQ